MYIFVIGKPRGISILECFLVLFLVILIALGPNYIKEEIKKWGNKFYNAEIEELKIPTIWGPIFIKIAQTPTELKRLAKPKIEIISEEKETHDITRIEVVALMAASIAKQKLGHNIINNGDFNIPLTSKLSKWGQGLYSEIIRKQEPGINFEWINFLNADIDISIKKTEIGNALEIMHKCETTPP